MKKVIALVMTIALLLGAAAAVAENAQVKVTNWADYEEAAKNVGGEFVSIPDSNLKVFVPKGWEEVKETDHFVLRTAGVDEKDPAFCILSVQKQEINLDTFAAMLQKTNPACLGSEQLNGANIIGYELVDVNGIKAQGIAFSADNGAHTLTVSLAPVSEANAKTVELIKASVQPAAN